MPGSTGERSLEGNQVLPPQNLFLMGVGGTSESEHVQHSKNELCKVFHAATWLSLPFLTLPAAF